jgi:hypothetical protein
MKTFSLEHNHPLAPEVFRERVLEQDMVDMIREMYNAGIEPAKIQKVVISRGLVLTTSQICSVAKQDAIANFVSESVELRRYVESLGGRVEQFSETINGRIQTVAILTQMPRELQDLKSLCDVLFLDGTHAQLKMRWEIIPVTMISPNRELVCGGVAFAAYFTGEVVEWLLQSIWESAPEVAENWRTLISDEDSAFLPAVERFRVGKASAFGHVLCAMHKKQNFVKKLNRSGETAKARKEISKLFDVVCYSEHRGIADSALKDIIDRGCEKLNRYIEKHIKPVMDQFALSRLHEVFSAGYNTSSCAESCNSMIKRGLSGRLCTLREARQHFDGRLENHRGILAAKAHRARREHSDLEEKLGIRLSPEIRREVLKEEQESEDLEIRESDDKFDVHSVNRPEVIYSVEESDGVLLCTCGKVRNAGYPCRHIFAVLRANGQPCACRYFNERWIIGRGTVGEALALEEADGGAEPRDSGSDNEDAEPVRNPESDIEESLPVTMSLGLDEAIENLPAMSQKNVYLTLWHFAKGVSSLAATSMDKAQWFMGQLKGVRERLLADAPIDPAAHEEFAGCLGCAANAQFLLSASKLGRMMLRPLWRGLEKAFGSTGWMRSKMM